MLARVIDPWLNGCVVLITGGASGIGAAISAAFATQEASVAVHYSDSVVAAPRAAKWQHDTPTPESAQRFARGLSTMAIAVGADLSDPSATCGLLADVESRIGPVDVLVNNAAHCESPDTIAELTGAGLQRHYQVNTIAPALLTSELARRGRGACIVNISTDAARAFPGQVDVQSRGGSVDPCNRVGPGIGRDSSQRHRTRPGSDRVAHRPRARRGHGRRTHGVG